MKLPENIKTFHVFPNSIMESKGSRFIYSKDTFANVGSFNSFFSFKVTEEDIKEKPEDYDFFREAEMYLNFIWEDKERGLYKLIREISIGGLNSAAENNLQIKRLTDEQKGDFPKKIDEYLSKNGVFPFLIWTLRSNTWICSNRDWNAYKKISAIVILFFRLLLAEKMDYVKFVEEHSIQAEANLLLSLMKKNTKYYKSKTHHSIFSVEPVNLFTWGCSEWIDKKPDWPNSNFFNIMLWVGDNEQIEIHFISEGSLTRNDFLYLKHIDSEIRTFNIYDKMIKIEKYFSLKESVKKEESKFIYRNFWENLTFKKPDLLKNKFGMW